MSTTKKAPPKFQTREEWLVAATAIARDELFAPLGYKVPEVGVTCGWPSVKAMGKKSRRIGECWSPKASKAGTHQIFISPILEDPAGPDSVLGVLNHELVHATVGLEAGHKKPFGKCARAIGLTGKLTATSAGDDLVERQKDWLARLGPYPHRKLDALQRPTKPQKNRQLKCECPKCGYICRVSKKWLEEVGAPICPADHATMISDDVDLDEDGE